MTSKLQYALAYVRRGIHVFPLQPNGKKPLPGSHGFKDATLKESQVYKWWSQNPDYNIGIAAEPSGLVIVDLDNRGEKKGSDSYAEISKGKTPTTFTVHTPSGGFHLYFSGDPVKSSVEELGSGVDIKSGGGYVVGAGSTIDGKPYELVEAADPAPVPSYLSDKLKRHVPKDPAAAKIASELDNASAVREAVAYLEREDPAVSGHGGDAHFYKVCQRVLDFGLSQNRAVAVLAKHYAPRCTPIPDTDWLVKKVRNAWAYRQEPVGIDNPDTAFEGLEIEDDEEGDDKPKRTLVAPFEWTPEESLPQRRWLLGRSLLRGKVSLIVATGGAGKSTYSLQEAMALATGRHDITGQSVFERVKVLVINNEDETDEMKRRLYGAMKFFNVTPAELKDLHIYSGEQHPFIMVRRNNKGQLRIVNYEETKKALVDGGIGCLVVDPLVETHEAEENNNVEMNFVMRAYRKLAAELNIAVQIIHHSGKPNQADATAYAGNANSSRGASSITSVARVVQTIYNMTEDEGTAFEVDHTEYVRLDDAKANLSARRKNPLWLHKTDVLLDNGDEVMVFQPEELTSRETEEREIIADTIGVKEEVWRLDAVVEALQSGIEYSNYDKKTLAKHVKGLFEKRFFYKEHSLVFKNDLLIVRKNDG